MTKFEFLALISTNESKQKNKNFIFDVDVCSVTADAELNNNRQNTEISFIPLVVEENTHDSRRGGRHGNAAMVTS